MKNPFGPLYWLCSFAITAVTVLGGIIIYSNPYIPPAYILFFFGILLKGIEFSYIETEHRMLIIEAQCDARLETRKDTRNGLIDHTIQYLTNLKVD